MGRKVGYAILLTVLFIVIAAALFFAHRNLRLGRGDRRGAARLALAGIALYTVSWLLEEHHVMTPRELVLFLMFASKVLTQAGLIWVVYIALEPLVRRRWPQILVSWTRLLAGEWRDPLVGRDILIGCVAGSGGFCLLGLRILADLRFGYSSPLVRANLDTLLGTASFVSVISSQFAGASLAFPLGILFLFLLMRIVLRNDGLAAAASVVLVFLPGNVSIDGWIGGLFGVIYGSLLMFVLIRFGLIGLSGFYVVALFPSTFPITLQTSAWYFAAGFAAMLVTVAIALYAFRISLGGRRLLEYREIP